MSTQEINEVKQQAIQEKIKLLFSQTCIGFQRYSTDLLYSGKFTGTQLQAIRDLMDIQRGSLFSLKTIRDLAALYRKLATIEKTVYGIDALVAYLYKVTYQAAEYVENYGEVEFTPIQDSPAEAQG